MTTRHPGHPPMTANDVRARFEAELMKLPAGAQTNIRDAMSRDESLSFNMFAAGYRAAIAKGTLQEKTTAKDEHEAFDAWWVTTGIVFSSDREIAWNAWNTRAAHADLSGEVRELVEAAEEMVGVYVAKYAMESGTTLGPLEFQFRALEAALAKFTQEKP